MKFSAESSLGAVQRTVALLERDAKPASSVSLSRVYDTTGEELWDALTNPKRLGRWFLPIEGDLQLGGNYQLEGNAAGTITDCVGPDYLALTWEFAGNLSWVEISLHPEASRRTRLTLTHTAIVDEHWKQYGPGATGVGWEQGLLGLAFHIREPGTPFDEADVSTSSEGKKFIRGSSKAWGEAAVKAGIDPTVAQAAASATAEFYTGEPDP